MSSLASCVGLFLLFITLALAHPGHSRGQLQRRAVDLEAYRFGGGGSYHSVPSSSKRSLKSKKKATNQDTAASFLMSTFPNTTFRLIQDHYRGDNGVDHFYFKQLANKLDIDNSNLNINVAKDGTIISYGHSLYTGAIPSARTLAKRDFVGPVMALKMVSQTLGLPITVDTATAKISGEVVGMEDAPVDASILETSALHGTYTITGAKGAYQDPTARLVYIQSETGSLSLVWRIETDIQDTWLLSYVDAQSANSIMGVVEYVAHASYDVFPWGQVDPTGGPRIQENNPYDPVASPFTWQNTSTLNFGSTQGNNAIAQGNWNGNTNISDDYRPRAGGANFTYPFDINAADPKSYIDASVTQLFYTGNMMHDLLYSLGFTESAGNFQEVNGNTAGVGGDPVILNSQDGSGLNNANFLTPPDGNSGRMRMYLWGTPNTAIPLRDSSFDADIVCHEYAHGLSNRLTGGPANSACLNTLEANGMGEGWSDFIAIAVNMNGGETRATNRVVAAWASGTSAGIRKVPYSTSLLVNPLKYSNVNGETISHNIGTVWNSMLYEVMWNLIDKHGLNAARKPTFLQGGVVPNDGRYLAMKLVIDAMALQPCNPSFVDARNAILDADEVLTGGENACQIWKGFAKRGLGSKVVEGRGVKVDDFSIPVGIC